MDGKPNGDTINPTEFELRRPEEEWEDFFLHYTMQIERRQAALFVGAGLSMDAGLPSWDDLVRQLVQTTLPQLWREWDLGVPLPSIAQYVVNQRPQNRDQLYEFLYDKLSSPQVSPTQKHRLIPLLGVDLLWTSNYDNLIERAYREREYPKDLDVIASGGDLSQSVDRGQGMLYKLHGTLANPSSIVITRQDYARYRSRNEAIYVALLNDLLRRTFLFIGFSFTDPNVLGVLDDAARLAGESPRPHYAIFKNDGHLSVSERLRIQDVKLFGVHPLFVKEWPAIEEHMNELRHRRVQHHILVSGSAHDMPEREKRISAFSEKLGRLLIEERYTIVCGLNPAVGRQVINGALEALYESGQQREVNRRILIWPLPAGHRNDRTEQKRLRLRYRDEMASDSGVGLFIGGGEGTVEEYNLLLDKGGRSFPIGAFGGTAASLWQERAKSMASEDSDVRDLFKALGVSTPDDAPLLDAIRRILRANRRTPKRRR